MTTWLLLLLAIGPDCWKVYDAAVDPCWQVYDACQTPCTVALNECSEPHRKARIGCRLREDWVELTNCLIGPNGTGEWCIIGERISLWGLVVVGLPRSCVTSLPYWCRYYDRDNDGDVDLRDVADWLRSYSR